MIEDLNKYTPGQLLLLLTAKVSDVGLALIEPERRYSFWAEQLAMDLLCIFDAVRRNEINTGRFNAILVNAYSIDYGSTPEKRYRNLLKLHGRLCEQRLEGNIDPDTLVRYHECLRSVISDVLGIINADFR